MAACKRISLRLLGTLGLAMLLSVALAAMQSALAAENINVGGRATSIRDWSPSGGLLPICATSLARPWGLVQVSPPILKPGHAPEIAIAVCSTCCPTAATTSAVRSRFAPGSISSAPCLNRPSDPACMPDRGATAHASAKTHRHHAATRRQQAPADRPRPGGRRSARKQAFPANAASPQRRHQPRRRGRRAHERRHLLHWRRIRAVRLSLLRQRPHAFGHSAARGVHPQTRRKRQFFLQQSGPRRTAAAAARPANRPAEQSRL